MLKRRYINILFTLLAVNGVLVGMEQPEKRQKIEEEKQKKFIPFLQAMALYKVVDEFMKLDIFSEQGSNSLALYADSLPLDLQKKICDRIVERNKTNIFQFIAPQVTQIPGNDVLGGFNIKNRFFVLTQSGDENALKRIPSLWHAGNGIQKLPFIEKIPDVQELGLTDWYVKGTLVTMLFDNLRFVREISAKKAVIVQYDIQEKAVKQVINIPLLGNESKIYLCGSDTYIKRDLSEENGVSNFEAFTIDNHVMIDSKQMRVVAVSRSVSLNNHTFALVDTWWPGANWHVWDVQAREVISYGYEPYFVYSFVQLDDGTVAISMQGPRHKNFISHLDLTNPPYNIEENKFSFETLATINPLGSFGLSTVVLGMSLSKQLYLLDLKSKQYMPIITPKRAAHKAFSLDLYTFVAIREATKVEPSDVFILQWPEYNLFSNIVLSHIATAMQTKRLLSLEELLNAYELINTVKSSLAEYDPSGSAAEKAHKQKNAEIRRQSLSEDMLQKFLRNSLVRLVDSYDVQERTLSLEEINQLRNLWFAIYPPSALEEDKEKDERDWILEFIVTHEQRLEAEEVTNQEMQHMLSE